MAGKDCLKNKPISIFNTVNLTTNINSEQV